MSLTEKLLVISGIFFFFLLNYPLLQIVDVPILMLGIPLTIFYLFFVWILAIICLILFGHLLKSRKRSQMVKP